MPVRSILAQPARNLPLRNQLPLTWQNQHQSHFLSAHRHRQEFPLGVSLSSVSLTGSNHTHSTGTSSNSQQQQQPLLVAPSKSPYRIAVSDGRGHFERVLVPKECHPKHPSTPSARRRNSSSGTGVPSSRTDVRSCWTGPSPQRRNTKSDCFTSGHRAYRHTSHR